MLAENLESWARREQQQGETRLLIKQIKVKFGELPDWAQRRLEHASADQLDEWSMRILTASSLDELFKQ